MGYVKLQSALPIYALLSILTLWEMTGRFLHIKEYLLPVPSQIYVAILHNWRTLAIDSLVTFAESAIALVIACFIAFVAAAMFHLCPSLRRAFLPIAIATKSVPIVVFAPLFSLWFGYGPYGKIALGVLVALLPVLVNATFGMDSPLNEQLDVFRLHRATRWQILTKLKLPSAIPFILPAVRLSVSLAVLGVVLAEMTGARSGLGATILITASTLDSPLLFAATLAALLVSGILLFFIRSAEIMALPHYRGDLTITS